MAGAQLGLSAIDVPVKPLSIMIDYAARRTSGSRYKELTSHDSETVDEQEVGEQEIAGEQIRDVLSSS